MGCSPEDQGQSGGSSSGSSRKGAEVELETPQLGREGEGKAWDGQAEQPVAEGSRPASVGGTGEQPAGGEAVKGRNSGPQKGMKPGRAMALLKSLPGSLLLDHLSPIRLRAFFGHSALE